MISVMGIREGEKMIFEYEYNLSYLFSRIHIVWMDPYMNKGFYIRLFRISNTAMDKVFLTQLSMAALFNVMPCDLWMLIAYASLNENCFCESLLSLDCYRATEGTTHAIGRHLAVFHSIGPRYVS